MWKDNLYSGSSSEEGCRQWCNRWGRGQSTPQTSDREIFADVSGKKRQGKKGKGEKIEKKRRKIVTGKVENWKRKERWKIWNGSWKIYKKRRGPCFLSFSFLFFFFVVLFSFVMFFFLLFTFQNDGNLSFSPIFPDFPLFFPIFGKFFAVRGGTLSPLTPQCATDKKKKSEIWKRKKRYEGKSLANHYRIPSTSFVKSVRQKPI